MYITEGTRTYQNFAAFSPLFIARILIITLLSLLTSFLEFECY